MRPRRGKAAGPTGPELQAAMHRVAEEYAAFVAGGPAPGTEGDPKAFTAHHAACRAALAHLEHLIRVARAMGGATGEQVAEADALLAEARDALAATPDQEETDPDEDGAPG